MQHVIRPENSWVMRFHPRSAADLRLFCFPYAGGSATLFQRWAQPGVLPQEVEVCAIELPGRGVRQQEQVSTQFSDLVTVLAEMLLPSLQEGHAFALFGHSLGALVSFEVARHLQERFGLVPVQLFVSGCSAPQLGDACPEIVDIPALVTYLRQLGARPNEQMLVRRWPLIQADFALRASYRYSAGGPPLACPITVFGGIQDDSVSRDALAAWREQTLETCTLHLLPGNHYFLHHAQGQLLRYLQSALRRVLRETPPERRSYS